LGVSIDSSRQGSLNSCRTADHRLRPQRPWLRLGVTVLAMTVTVLCVFFVVPRGSAVGSIRFVPHNWHQKSDHGTYTLQLGVHIPITNYNYYPVSYVGLASEILVVLCGDVRYGVSFMSTQMPPPALSISFSIAMWIWTSGIVRSSVV
jgi:hypothetical protein